VSEDADETETFYSKCEACGCPILPRTHARNQGLFRNCRITAEARKRPRREYPPEQFDPLESDPMYRWLIEKVDAEAEEAALNEIVERFPYISRDDAPIMGLCHCIWRHKKRILKDEHGLEWKAPRELNPHIWYD
jgi:hypothetical protein